MGPGPSPLLDNSGIRSATTASSIPLGPATLHPLLSPKVVGRPLLPSHGASSGPSVEPVLALASFEALSPSAPILWRSLLQVPSRNRLTLASVEALSLSAPVVWRFLLLVPSRNRLDTRFCRSFVSFCARPVALCSSGSFVEPFDTRFFRNFVSFCASLTALLRVPSRNRFDTCFFRSFVFLCARPVALVSVSSSKL